MYFKKIKILDKDFKLRDNQYVVTEGAFIKYIGDTEPKALSKNDEVIDGKNRLLIPAFFNTHCHVSMTLLRGYGEGLPLDKWLNDCVFPFEAHFQAEEKRAGALLGACELIKSGCVSISDMYSELACYGEAIHSAGMKANICNGLICFDENKSFYDTREYRDTCGLMEWIKSTDDGRIKADASIHSEYTTCRKSNIECIEFAAENHLGMQVHISETRSEHTGCLDRHGMTPAEYFYEMGMFKLPVTAAHCVWSDEKDIEILRSAGASVAYNPSSNLKLGSGIAPVRKYMDEGINVTFGTDGASSNNNLNMLEEIRIGALLSGTGTDDKKRINAPEILRMATENGAKAQGRYDCGVIDEGRRADLIVFDLDRPHYVPKGDILEKIVYSSTTDDIYMTVCDGITVCREGHPVFIDEEKVKADAAQAFSDVLGRF